MKLDGLFRDWTFEQYRIKRDEKAVWVGEGKLFAFTDCNDAGERFVDLMSPRMRKKVWREYKRECNRRSVKALKSLLEPAP